MKNKLSNFVQSQSDLHKEIGQNLSSYIKQGVDLSGLEALDEQFIFNNNPEGKEDD